MSPLWQALLQVSEAREPAVTDTTRNSGALSGGTFLDFLYPPGALILLRQYPPWMANGLERQRHGGLFNRLGRRSYSAAAGEERTESNHEMIAEPYFDDIDQDVGDNGAEEDVMLRLKTDEPHVRSATAAPLLDIIRHGRSNDYEEAWRQYRMINSDDQKLLVGEMIDYFSTSERKTDARRTIQLFEDIRQDASELRWRAMLRAQVTLGNFEGAMEEHSNATQKFHKLIESDRVIGSLISNNQWDLAYELWRDINTFKNENPDAKGFKLWTYFTKLPDVVDKALEIDGYFNSVRNSSDDLNRFLGEILQKALFPENGLIPAEFVKVYNKFKRLRMDQHYISRASTSAVIKLVNMRENKLAVYLYKNIRSRNDMYFTTKLLKSLLKICCRNEDFEGQDMVLYDWANCYGYPTSEAYRMCIESRALVGDAKKVHELFAAMSRRNIRSPDDFNPLLNVHARRGELSDCLQIFGKIKSKYGFEQTTTHHNILLNAYGKVSDIDSAFVLYDKMVAKGMQDNYTVGSMMGICAQRGDKDSVYDIYNTAISAEISPTPAMIDCLVHVHVQGGELEEAERWCKDSLNMRLAKTTRRWNYLLVAYAMRRDIRNVYRIHHAMETNDVPFDGHTYSALLLALAVGGQPSKALKIMNEVMPEAGIKATNFHYAVVMGGYIKTKEYAKVIWLHKKMQGEIAKQAIREGVSTRIQVAKAAAMLDQKYMDEGTPAEQFKIAQKYLFESLTESDPMELASTSRKGIKGSDVLDIAGVFAKFDFFIFLLGQSRAFEKARELQQQFLGMLPADRQMDLPLSFYSSLMISQYKEKNFEGVQDTWELALNIAKHQGRDVRGGRLVLLSHRFVLARALSVLIQAYRDNSKIAQLKVAIKQLQGAGFALDSKNWNLYIQALTRSHHYTEAFELCEQKLMPGWLGWQKVRATELRRNRLDILTRRKKEDSAYLRPIFHTLLYLTKAYLEMEGAVELDSGFQKRLAELERTCPRTLEAIRKMQKEGDDLERVVLGE